MRTLISAFAGLALLAGVSSPVHAAAPDVPTTQPEYIIPFTAGQGGGMVFTLPATSEQRVTAGPSQAIAVTAGQAGSITVVVSGPGVDVVAQKPATQPAADERITLLPMD